MTVCPILKTREMLYRGGYVADEDDGDRVVEIDGADMVFDDAPVIIGVGSFRATRSGGSDDDKDDDVNRLRILPQAYTIAARQSVHDLIKTGGTTVPEMGMVVDGYRKRGGNDLMKIEKLARDDVRDYYHRRRNEYAMAKK